MTANATTLFLCLAMALMPCPLQAQSQGEVRGAEGLISVGPNVHVSTAHARYGMGEVLLSADPDDPNHLLGCGVVYAEDENRRWTVAYLSTDGGQTWSPTLETKKFNDSADEACVLGHDGRANYVAMAVQDPEYYALVVYHSNDGGRTWEAQPELPMRFQGIDRESIAVDLSDGEYSGNVYVTGTSWMRALDGSSKGAMAVWRSRDGGRTFDALVKRSSPGNRYVLGVGNSVVLTDGTLVTLFGELKDYDSGSPVQASEGAESNAILEVITSDDGGASISEAVKVADFFMLWPPTAGSATPTLAADPGSEPFKDRLYAVWADMRSGRSEILLSYSSDKGQSWSSPVTINDDRPFREGADGPNNFMPTVAVNLDGVVGVTWYDRRDHPDNLGWYVRFRASLDGGETWLPSVRVSDAPNTYDGDEHLLTGASTSGGGSENERLRGGPVKVNVSLLGRQFNAGDYAGLAAAADGTFHAFWIDNRTGMPQIWTAPITVQGVAVRNGSPELAQLEDISEKVTFELRNSRYDRAHNTISFTARLKNTSDDSLSGPFKVRVIELVSQLAYGVQVENSDNGRSGPGAVWDFSGVVEGGMLEPGDSSEAKPLLFRLSDLRPLRDGNDLRLGLLELDVRILGHSAPAERVSAGSGDAGPTHYERGARYSQVAVLQLRPGWRGAMHPVRTLRSGGVVRSGVRNPREKYQGILVKARGSLAGNRSWRLAGRTNPI